MPLPRIDQPLFELTIPSTGQKVKYRPFTVKEEKILLIAQESKEIDQTILAIKQIINNCFEEEVNVESLALFDLEYMIVKLRSKSVNNIVNFSIKDPDTHENVELSLDLENVGIKTFDNHSNRIELKENVTLFLRYPTINELKDMMENPNDNTVIFEIMFRCLDKLVIDDNLYKLSDYSNEEITEFVENLSGDIITNLKDFYQTMPKVSHSVPYVRKDGTKKIFVMEGLDNFFI